MVKFPHIVAMTAVSSLAFLLAGCGGDPVTEPDVTTFPKELVTDIGSSGSSGEGSESEVSESDAAFEGLKFTASGTELRASESQITLTNNIGNGFIGVNITGSNGVTYTLNFTFTTIGQTLPKEYRLVTGADAQIGPDTAVLTYAESITGDFSAAQSLSNDLFRLEVFTDTRAEGSFNFTTVLDSSEERAITDGRFVIGQ